MKNFIQLVVVLLLSVFTFQFAQAQMTDVTDLYLGENAGFDTEFNFNKNTFVIDNNQVLDVYGWTRSSTVTYTVAGTIEYEIPVGFNGSAQPPAQGYDEQPGGALALTTGWGEPLHYFKDVTLHPGKYTIVAPILNLGSTTAGGSLVGWISADDKSTSMSTINSFPIGEWIVDEIDFVIEEESEGKIQVGLQSIFGTGSGNTAKIIIDYVKLYFHDVKKDDLRSKIDEVIALNYEGKPGQIYLEDIVAQAEVIYADDTATLIDVVNIIEELDSAVELYQNALFSSLKINDIPLLGFDSNKFEYTYVVNAKNEVEIPVASPEALGEVAGASFEIEYPVDLPGDIVITVTAGDGETQNIYTIAVNINFLAGWDGYGVTGEGSEPFNFGWEAKEADIHGWGTSVTGMHSQLQSTHYRDDFPAGSGKRSISRFHTNEMYIPVELKGGVIYEFSGSTWKINTACTNTFEINTSNNRDEGRVLGSVSNHVGGSEVKHNFEFLTPEDGVYYLHWHNTPGHDRIVCFDLFIYETDKEPLSVDFDTDGGSEIASQYFTPGNVIVEPEAPTKEGYEFDGWWYTEDGFELRWNFDMTVNEGFTLLAKWLPTVFYDVTFDSNGGTDVPSQSVREGALIEIPGSPSKENNLFLGWYLGEDEWDFNRAIVNDITLVAKWEVVTSIFENRSETIQIYSQTNGVKIVSYNPVDVYIYELTGALISKMNQYVGEEIIALPSGIYIINGNKVIVK